MLAKPPSWNVSPALIEPRWRKAWLGLADCFYIPTKRLVNPITRGIGTNAGALDLIASPYGPALQFGASTIYVEFADDRVLPYGNQVTFIVILRVDAFPGNGQDYIADIWTDENNDVDATVGFRLGAGGVVQNRQKFASGSTSGEPMQTSDLDTDTWYHIALVMDANASVARFYLDGVPDGTPSFSWSAPSEVDRHWRMGMTAQPDYQNRPFEGAVALMLRSRRAWTQNEIYEHYLDPFGMFRLDPKVIPFVAAAPAANTRRYSLTTMGVG